MASVVAALIIAGSSLCLAESTMDIMSKARRGNAEAQYKIAALYASGKLGDKSEESKQEMFEWLEKAAEQGHAKAQEILYKKYFEQEKFANAAKWAQEAMKRNDKVAISIMAYLNYFGCSTVPIDRRKAFELSDKTMEQPLSQVIQGRFYLTGCDKFEIDIMQAMACAENAIKKKSPYGYILMADAYLANDEEDENINSAEDNLQKAVKMNCTAAMVALGDLYLKYKATTENTHMAIKLYTKAASMHNAAAFRQLGLHVLKNNTKENPLDYLDIQLKAMNAIVNAAEKGDPQSLFIMWDALTNEKYGFPRNINSARNYFKLAISSGDPEIFFCFAKLLLDAENSTDKKKSYLRKTIEKKYTKDILLQKAADNFHAPASFMYFNLLKINNEDGALYLEQAAKMGIPEAQSELAYSYLQKSNPEQAYYWAEKGAKNENPNAMVLTGILSLTGNGCEQNVEYGIEKLKQAAEYGDKIAAQRLACEFYNGDKVNQDLNQAYMYAIFSSDESVKPIIEVVENTIKEDELENNAIAQLFILNSKALANQNVSITKKNNRYQGLYIDNADLF